MRPIQYTEVDGRQARQCTRCGAVKPFDDFPWDSRRDKPQGRCFNCANAARRAQYVPRGRTSVFWWTPEQIDALRRARDVAEAAALTGRTIEACRNKSYDFGIRFPRRKSSGGTRSKYAGTKLEAAIIEAAGKRISFEAIAARHGITKNTVAGIVWRWRQRRGG